MDVFDYSGLVTDIFILFEQKKNKLKELEIQNSNISEKTQVIEHNIENIKKERFFLQRCSEEGKNQAEKILENVNNRMLKYVFPYDIKLDIEQRIVNGSTRVNCFTEIKKDNGTVIRREPTEGGGLGIVDAISIATRNVFLNEVDLVNKAPIFFDEPGKYVSNEYIVKIADYLQKSQNCYNRQMFLITHDDFISRIGDKSICVELNSQGYSNVFEI